MLMKSEKASQRTGDGPWAFKHGCDRIGLIGGKAYSIHMEWVAWAKAWRWETILSI